MQQQLAKLQMTLEKTHDNYNVVTKIREQVRGVPSTYLSDRMYPKGRRPPCGEREGVRILWKRAF